MKSREIGMLDPLGRHAGFHYYTEGLGRALAGEGVSTTVYGFNSPACEEGLFRSVSAFSNLYGGDPSWRRGLRYVWGLLSALLDAKGRKIQLLHMHCFHYDLRERLAALLVKIFGFRLVVTLHDIDSFGKSHGRSGRRQILKLTDGVIVHNSFSFDVLTKSGEMDAGVTSAVIAHGHYIDNYPYQPAREVARERLALAEEKTIALFFGNPRAEKGLDLLLEAAQAIKDSRLLVVVAGKIREEQLADLKALEDGRMRGLLRVDAGHVSDEDAERYYRAADLIVIPYRRIYESGVAIMAMSFGRCVLYSDLPPLVESVGEVGISFRSEDAADLATQLQAALREPGTLDVLGNAGKERIKLTRSWPLIARQTAQAYAAVLDEKPAHA